MDKEAKGRSPWQGLQELQAAILQAHSLLENGVKIIETVTTAGRERDQILRTALANCVLGTMSTSL